jgi:hypothetical protein
MVHIGIFCANFSAMLRQPDRFVELHFAFYASIATWAE